MRRKNPATKSAKKSGGPKIKIREKSVLPKTDTTCIANTHSDSSRQNLSAARLAKGPSFQKIAVKHDHSSCEWRKAGTSVFELHNCRFYFIIGFSRRRTNVQQLTCKIDLSSSFYYLFLSFVLLELKPFVLKGKVPGEKL